jgi:predicted nucleic acid-binding protein
MTFVDSGAWFATFVPSDRSHVEATRWFHQNSSPLITTDYVVDETLALLRARGELDRAVAVAFFSGELATIHYLTPDEIGRLGASSEVSPTRNGASPTAPARS